MNDIDKYLKRIIEKDKSPSVQYYLFNSENIIHHFSAGYADIANQIKADENTKYSAFSVTKTFTALAVLQLAEQGKIDLNNPIKDYLHDFPYNSAITIKQLLSHSAGIPNPIPLSWIHLVSEHNHFNREEFFKEIFNNNIKTKSEPNEKFRYSNLGYIILGQLIEKVSGKTFEQYLNNNIIKQINIDNEQIGFTLDTTSKYAKGYHKKMSFTYFILGWFLDKDKFIEKQEKSWMSFKKFYVNGASYGGLIGTPLSFVRYIQVLLKSESRIISADYKKIMFTENITNNGKPTGMCLSWFKGNLKGKKYFCHAGGGGGYYCEIRFYPNEGIGSVIFLNRTGMSDERILDQIDDHYFKHTQR
ncbi:MAG: hypothetical protein Kow00102_02150 [Spirochaetota bacterium]